MIETDEYRGELAMKSGSSGEYRGEFALAAFGQSSSRRSIGKADGSCSSAGEGRIALFD